MFPNREGTKGALVRGQEPVERKVEREPERAEEFPRDQPGESPRGLLGVEVPWTEV